MSFRRCACFLLMLSGLAVAVSHAATNPATPILDTMTDEFQGAAGRWEGKIASAALRLFFLLGTLDIIWTGLVIALKGSGLQEFAAELVRRLLFIGFFLALLLNAHEWSRTIVNSFQEIGTEAVRDTVGPELDQKEFGENGELKPSAVAAKGILYSRRITNSAPSILKHAGGAVFFGLAAICVLGGFGAIAARQVMVLAEMYIVLSAGIILLGFGATRWTNEYALKYLRYCASVGIKLMFVQLSVALALHFLATLTNRSTPYSFTRASSITLSVVVLVAVIWSIPSIVAGFMRGESATTGAEMALSGQVMSTAANSIGSTAASGGRAVVSAAKLAVAQNGLRSGVAAGRPDSGLAHGLARPSGTATSLARNLASNLSRAAVSAARSDRANEGPNRGGFPAAMTATLEAERARIAARKSG